MPDEWSLMLEFVDEILKHADSHMKHNGDMGKFIFQRIAIIHYDHAIELILKAYLLKNDYIINRLSNSDIKRGIKTDAKFFDLIDKNKTLNFTEIIGVADGSGLFQCDEKSKILEFHKIRNEIQHSALNVPPDKEGKLNNIKPIIQSIYERAFANRKFPLNP